MTKFLIISLFWQGSLILVAQSNISGEAGLLLVDAGMDCNGFARRVEVFTDVEGLVGDGGEVGMNAFVLVFDLDRPEVFVSALPGSTPDLDWQLVISHNGTIGRTGKLHLAGWVADTNAPNQNYHLATFIFSGDAGPLNLVQDLGLSSLGSRRVNGEGPDLIPFQPANLLSITIPADLTLDLGIAIEAWLTELPEYDLAAPTGPLNILDLSKLITCGGGTL